MALIHISCLILALIDMLVSYGGPAFVAAKVYMVVMEDEPVISYKARHHRVSYGLYKAVLVKLFLWCSIN